MYNSKYNFIFPVLFQGYKLIWKGNSGGTAGVGVLVASELADRIIRVERISDRVIAVSLVIGE